jgi:hypothetical protein
MRLGPVEVATPTLVLFVLATALCGAVLVGGTTSSAAFTPYNPGWEGLSELETVGTQTGAESIVVTDVGQYAEVEADGTVAVITAPPAYSPGERARLRQFVERGGTLVVAARDPERANPLLRSLGTNVTVDGRPLRDEQEYGRTPDFPLVTSVADRSLAADANGLSLNYGTALVVENGTSARSIANSSSFSYLDGDGDDTLDDDETLESRPVVASQPVGTGTVIVVSDPSVFINGMLERDANRAFAVGLLSGKDRVLIDRTASSVPPLTALLVAIRGTPALSSLFVLLAIGGVLGWERRLDSRPLQWLRSWRTDEYSGVDEWHEPDSEAVAAYLDDQAPDWDERRRDRVLGGIMKARQQRSHDDRDD